MLCPHRKSSYLCSTKEKRSSFLSWTSVCQKAAKTT